MEPAKHIYHLDAAQLFTIFFVMMGPLRLLGPFAKLGIKMDSTARWKVSILSPLITLISLIAAGFIGSGMLNNWNVPNVTLMLAAGIIFFLTALKPLINPGHELDPNYEASTHPGDIALNLIMTSYGVATVIVLMSASQGAQRTQTIILALAAVMGLNILAMAFGHYLLKLVGVMPLKILGSALGSLQLALAIQIMLASFKSIHS